MSIYILLHAWWQCSLPSTTRPPSAPGLRFVSALKRNNRNFSVPILTGYCAHEKQPPGNTLNPDTSRKLPYSAQQYCLTTQYANQDSVLAFKQGARSRRTQSSLSVTLSNGTLHGEV
ncbi:MAG: hypothetical protein J3Q66DRAFT_347027 [Benniella sp.]|nr:MAG: hypothetical protein J3Q66DRAFT_347027 [Benniella sp.]